MSKIGVSETVPEPAASAAAPGVAGAPGDAGSENWDEPLGLADRFDDLLLRLEVWRERPKVAGSLIIGSVVLVGLAWWLTQPAAPIAVEHAIPMASPDGPSDALSDGTGGDGEPSGSQSEDPPDGSLGGGVPTSSEPARQVDAADDSIPIAEAEELVVHVVGEVERPGLVRVAPGSRIDDALRAAGGPTEEADVERLNLAAPAADGIQVRVPARGEEPDGALIIAPPVAPAAVAEGEVASEVDTGPINLNTASEAKLQDLPGVGPATAAAIVTWRDDNGGFLAVDDLTQVPGIGPVKLAALRDLVSV